MKFDLAEVSTFLGVQGNSALNDDQEFEFRISRKSDFLNIRIHVGRSLVDIEIVGPDNTRLFSAAFACCAIRVINDTSHKVKPFVQMELERATLEFGLFGLHGPPAYELCFHYFDVQHLTLGPTR